MWQNKLLILLILLIYPREDLERIQKRALRCIFPGVPYSTALELANIQSIDDHHEALTNKLFQNIKESPHSKLKHLLRERHESTTYDLRVQNPLVVPRTKTKRFSNSFIIAGSQFIINQIRNVHFRLTKFLNDFYKEIL
jgi:hypothetical protein